MASLLESIQLRLNVDNTGANREFKDTGKISDAVLSSMQSGAAAFNAEWSDLTRGIKDTKRIVSGILISQAFYAISNSIAQASAAVIKFSNDMANAQISMEYFVEGSDKAAKAAAYLRTIKDFAANTPFDTASALAMSKYMQAMGVGMDTTKSVLSVISDTAAATGATEENMQRIVFGLGQMLTKGRLANEEIRQLANANIPIYDILKDKLKLTGEQISNIGNYWIPADKAVTAILSGLEDKYAGAADKVSNTFGGMVETLKDNSLIIAQTFLSGTYDKATEKLLSVRDALNEYRDVITEKGSPGLIHQVLQDIDGTGMLGTYALAAAGSVHKLLEELRSTLAVGAPLGKILAEVGYAGFLTLTVTIRSAIKAVTDITQCFDWLIQKVTSVTGHTVSLAQILGSLLVLSKIASVAVFAGNALFAVASSVAATTSAVWALIPGLNGLSFTMKSVITGLTGIVGAAFLAYNALNMVSNFGGIDSKSASNGLPSDYEQAYKEYEEKMKVYNESISKYYSDYDKPFSDLASDATSAFSDITDASSKAAESVKSDWLASFDEVFAIPKNNAVDALADKLALADMGAELQKPIFKFPTKEKELPKAPTMDMSNVYSTPGSSSIAWLTSTMPALIAIALAKVVNDRKKLKTANNAATSGGNSGGTSGTSKIDPYATNSAARDAIKENTTALNEATKKTTRLYNDIIKTDTEPSNEALNRLAEGNKVIEKALNNLNKTFDMAGRAHAEEPAILKQISSLLKQRTLDEAVTNYTKGTGTDSDVIKSIKQLPEDMFEKFKTSENISRNSLAIEKALYTQDERALRIVEDTHKVLTRVLSDKYDYLNAENIALPDDLRSNIANLDKRSKDIAGILKGNNTDTLQAIQKLNETANGIEKLQKTTAELKLLNNSPTVPSNLVEPAAKSLQDSIALQRDSLRIAAAQLQTVLKEQRAEYEDVQKIRTADFKLTSTIGETITRYIPKIYEAQKLLATYGYQALLGDKLGLYYFESATANAVTFSKALEKFKNPSYDPILKKLSKIIDVSKSYIADGGSTQKATADARFITTAFKKSLFDAVDATGKELKASTGAIEDIKTKINELIKKAPKSNAEIAASISAVTRRAELVNNLAVPTVAKPEITADAFMTLIRKQIRGSINEATDFSDYKDIRRQKLEKLKIEFPDSINDTWKDILEELRATDKTAKDILAESTGTKTIAQRLKNDIANSKKPNGTTDPKVPTYKQMLDKLTEGLPALAEPRILGAGITGSVDFEKTLPDVIKKGVYNAYGKEIPIFNPHDTLYAGQLARAISDSAYSQNTLSLALKGLNPLIKELAGVEETITTVDEYNRMAFGKSIPDLMLKHVSETLKDFGMSISKGLKITDAKTGLSDIVDGVVYENTAFWDKKTAILDGIIKPLIDKRSPLVDGDATTIPNERPVQYSTIDVTAQRTNKTKSLVDILEKYGTKVVYKVEATNTTLNKLLDKATQAGIEVETESSMLTRLVTEPKIIRLDENGFEKLRALFPDIYYKTAGTASITGAEKAMIAFLDVNAAKLTGTVAPNIAGNHLLDSDLGSKQKKYIDTYISKFIVENKNAINEAFANNMYIIEAAISKEAKETARQYALTYTANKVALGEFIKTNSDLTQITKRIDKYGREIGKISDKRLRLTDFTSKVATGNAELNKYLSGLFADLKSNESTFSTTASKNIRMLIDTIEGAIKGKTSDSAKVALTMVDPMDGRFEVKKFASEWTRVAEHLRASLDLMPSYISTLINVYEDEARVMNNAYQLGLSGNKTILEGTRTLGDVSHSLAAVTRSLEDALGKRGNVDMNAILQVIKDTEFAMAIPTDLYKELDIKGYTARFEELTKIASSSNDTLKTIAKNTDATNTLLEISTANKLVGSTGNTDDTIKAVAALEKVVEEVSTISNTTNGVRELGLLAKLTDMSAGTDDTAKAASEILKLLSKAEGAAKGATNLFGNTGGFVDVSALGEGFSKIGTKFVDMGKTATKIFDAFTFNFTGLNNAFKEANAASRGMYTLTNGILKDTTYVARATAAAKVVLEGAAMIGAMLDATTAYKNASAVMNLYNNEKNYSGYAPTQDKKTLEFSTGDTSLFMKTVATGLTGVFDGMFRGLLMYEPEQGTSETLKNYNKMTPEEQNFYGNKYLENTPTDMLGTLFNTTGGDYSEITRVIRDSFDEANGKYAYNSLLGDKTADKLSAKTTEKLNAEVMKWLKSNLGKNEDITTLVTRANRTGSDAPYAEDIRQLTDFKEAKKYINEFLGITPDLKEAITTLMSSTSGVEFKKAIGVSVDTKNADNINNAAILKAKDIIDPIVANIKNTLMPIMQAKRDVSTGASMFTGSTTSIVDLGKDSANAKISFSEISAGIKDQILQATGLVLGTYTDDTGKMFDTLGTNFDLFSKNIIGWTQKLPDGITFGDISTEDATILAKAGIQINSDGTVSLMKAANIGMTGTDRETSLQLSDVSETILAALKSTGFSMSQNSTYSGPMTAPTDTGTDLAIDPATASAKMQSAMFMTSKDLTGQVSDEASKALANLGKFLDSGYFEITNTAVLNGKITIAEYVKSMGVNAKKLSPEIVTSLEKIDDVIKAGGARTKETIAKIANGITLKSPISAEQLTPEIQSAFAKVGVTFKESTAGLMMVVNQLGDNFKDGVTLIPEETWNKLSTDVQQKIKGLGATITTANGITTVDIGTALEGNLSSMMEVYVNNSEAWNVLPQKYKDALAATGIVSKDGFLTLTQATCTSLTQFGNSWGTYWSSFGQDQQKAIMDKFGGMGLTMSSEMLKIQIASGEEAAKITEGVKVPLASLPPFMLEQMGLAGKNLEGQYAVLKDSTAAGFLGVNEAVYAAMSTANKTAKDQAADLATTIANAMNTSTRLTNAAARSRDIMANGAPGSGAGSRAYSIGGTSTGQGIASIGTDKFGTSYIVVPQVDKSGKITAYTAEYMNGTKGTKFSPGQVTLVDGKYNIPQFKNGGIIGADDIYRAGEFGMHEAVIPLERPTALKQVGSAIAAAMPSAELLRPLRGMLGVPNGGVSISRANNNTPATDPNALVKSILQAVLPTLVASKQSDNANQLVYVNTLIADDQGLRELDRRMQVVRISEGKRGS